MASGCQVVTSDLAALPETTAGFAQLVSFDGDRQAYRDRFVEATVEALRTLTGSVPAEAQSRLRKQVEHVNANYSWTVLASHWVRWLARMSASIT
jgi:hypothetical protein